MLTPYEMLIRELADVARAESEQNDTPPEHWDSTPHYLLLKSLHDKTAGPADIASHIRMVLRYEHVKNGDPTAKLPTNVLQRAGACLVQASVKMGSTENGWVEAWANPWQPDWLPDTKHHQIDEAVALIRRSNPEHHPGDPVLTLLGPLYKNYKSHAQQSGLRAVLCAPPGHTVVLGLPTGAGKTLCVHLPAIMAMSPLNGNPGVSVLVTPTVSLAIDMQTRFQDWFQHTVVYRGLQMEKEERDAMLSRCRCGEQGLLITAPEALPSLMECLRTAAREGYLRYFVVDEAHMVLNWGDEFRPDYLALPSMRNELDRVMVEHEKPPCVTVLMSATFTEYHLRSLQKLFISDGGFSFYHATYLRPEPAYWIAEAKDESERRAWVLEAAFTLPKPMIIYATNVDNCADTYAMIKKAGFHRTAMMIGASEEAAKQQLMDQWRQSAVDIVVATSAFGLGVDKKNIRSIVHAQLPESIDRFYQDVGRSGRDGFASVSLLAFCDSDWRRLPKGAKVISEELGVDRWTRMREQWTSVDGEHGVYLVDTRKTRNEEMSDSDENSKWNRRTLILMQRAGLLEFRPDVKSRRWQWPIAMLGHPPDSRAVWEERVTPIREEIVSAYRRTSALLRRLSLTGRKECLGEVFACCYESKEHKVFPMRSCGGCPSCRSRHERPYGSNELLIRTSAPQTKSKWAVQVSETLQEILRGCDCAFVHYDTWDEASIKNLVIWLASSGMPNFIGERHVIGPWLEEAVLRDHSIVAFLHNGAPELSDPAGKEPCVCLVGPNAPPWWPSIWTRMGEGRGMSPFIVIGPQDLEHPEHAGRQFTHMDNRAKLSIAQWKEHFNT
jgi:ATP-dependent DNA helicase RecQ